jgi:hypothetical protein
VFAAVVVAVMAALVALATGAEAAPPTDGPTQASIAASLHGDALAKWKALTGTQKALTVRILNEPTFRLPAAEADLQAKYPELQVTESQGTDTDATATTSKTALATATSCTLVGRTSWVSQYWSILGIDYATVRTTIGYSTSCGVVRSVSRCYGTSTNYVPLRSIDSNSWYTLGNGLADCWTEWTLGRLCCGTTTGIQGLRVDGYGNIIKRWNV